MLRQQFALDKHVNGLVIIDVDMDGAAVEQGLGEGDVVVSINQKKADMDVMHSEIETAKTSGRNAVLLMMNRRGTMQFVAVKLSDESEK